MEPKLEEFLKIVITLVVGVLLGMSLLIFAQSNTFGKYQHLGNIVDRYERCKAEVPGDMDCIMVPMAVSKEFMQEVMQEESNVQ